MVMLISCTADLLGLVGEGDERTSASGGDCRKLALPVVGGGEDREFFEPC